nr:reverse transcriptase domain-containing protein [Tanacetum cinerariifolium]
MISLDLLNKETFGEAWERFKEILRQCLHHGFSELHQIDTFYNGLNEHDQDSLNVAAGENLLRKTPRDALTIIENKSKIDNFKAGLNNEIHSSMQNQINSVKNELKSDINKLRNIMASYFQKDTASTLGSGSLPSNIVANQRGDLKAITTRSGVSYDGPPVPPSTSSLPKEAERVPEVTKDTVQPSTENIQPPVAQTQVPINEPVVASKPKPTIPYPSRANKQKLREFENGPLLWPTVKENRVTYIKKYSELSATEAIQADCDVNVTNIILQGLPPEVYALVSTHKVAKELWERIQMLMQVVTSRYPPTNNQLRTSSNPRQQATINNGRITIQPIQGRQNYMNAGMSRQYTAGPSGTAGKQRVIVCYNCKGEGHMSKQCTKPKRNRDEAWFKDKVLLVQAQANG